MSAPASAHFDAAQTLANRLGVSGAPPVPMAAPVAGTMLPPNMLQGLPIPGLMQPFFVPGASPAATAASAAAANPYMNMNMNMNGFVPSLPLPFFQPVFSQQLAQVAQAQAAQMLQASSLASPLFAMPQPSNLSAAGPLRRPSLAKQRHCSCCGVTKTPMWRDARGGKYLCNACGIRWRKHRVRCTQCQYVPRKSEGDLKMCPRCDTPLFKGEVPAPSATSPGASAAAHSSPSSPPPPAIALVETPDVPNKTNVPTSIAAVTAVTVKKEPVVDAAVAAVAAIAASSVSSTAAAPAEPTNMPEAQVSN